MSLAKITREFLSKGREPVEPSDRIFPPVDVDNIRSDTTPQVKGQVDGEAGVPLQQATALTATELAILAEFERAQHIYLNTHDRMQSAYVTLLNPQYRVMFPFVLMRVVGSRQINSGAKVYLWERF